LHRRIRLVDGKATDTCVVSSSSRRRDSVAEPSVKVGWKVKGKRSRELFGEGRLGSPGGRMRGAFSEGRFSEK